LEVPGHALELFVAVAEVSLALVIDVELLVHALVVREQRKLNIFINFSLAVG